MVQLPNSSWFMAAIMSITRRDRSDWRVSDFFSGAHYAYAVTPN
jgi:hypothetical protein